MNNEERGAVRLAISYILFLSTCIPYAQDVCADEGQQNWVEKHYEFDIPTSDVDVALMVLARKTRHSLIILSEDISGIRTNALKGVFQIEQALSLMLKGTGLSGGLTNRGVITISKTIIRNDGQGGLNTMKDKTKLSLLASVTSFFFGTNIATAQDQSSVEQVSTFDEIIVTAQRRNESLQDVSMAISAFSGENISERGVKSLEELTEFVPGVELFDDRGAGQPTWVIRGVGLADFNANNTPTAAIYYDDYYLTSNVLGGIGMFDIASVEVLKGPQGGLYGRNTSGGAVKVNSASPVIGETLNGFADVTYGSWNRLTAEAAMGGSISDRVAFRIAGMVDQGGGWQDSLVTPQDDNWGDRDFWAIRGQVLAQLTEEIDVKIKIEGGQNKSETTLGYAKAAYDPATGDLCASVLAGVSDPATCVTWHNITNAFALTGDYGLTPDLQSDDGSVVLSSPINRLDDNWIGLNLQVNADLGFATLTSITGYIDYNNSQVFDFDATPLTLFHEQGEANLKSWSQEFRLISNSDSKLSWILGGLYAFDEDNEFRRGSLENNVLVFPTIVDRSFTQKTESWAVYAQLDYRINENVKVHSSLRYTDEHKDYLDGDNFDVLGGFYYIEDYSIETDLKANWSGHIGVDWKPNDDLLLYTRATKGFKSGGFFGGFTFTPDELSAYSEETVYSYEVGMKSGFLNNSLRMNMAAFLYDYNDVQGFTQVFGEFTQTILTKLGNLGDARHKGIELDVMWTPEGLPGFMLQGSGAWLDAKITNSDTLTLDPEGNALTIEGNRRPFAPKWSFNLSSSYERPISEVLKAGISMNYSWRSDLADLESLSHSLSSLALLGHEGYGVLNGRIFIGAQSEKWELYLSARNLTDNNYLVRSTTDDLLSYSAFYARPMSLTAGLKVNW